MSSEKDGNPEKTAFGRALPEEVLLAVIGHPVGHSLSPAMHNRALRAGGFRERYGMADVAPEELEEWCRFAAGRLKGFNVTVPHKEAIIPFIDHIEPLAAMTGCVNTVKVNPDGTLSGDTTDGRGFLDAAGETLGFHPGGAVLAVFGAGGAARAIVFACAAAGAREIMIFNRGRERAETLASDLRRHFPALRCSVWSNADAGQPGLLEAAELTVQATSLGLSPEDPMPIPPEAVARCRSVYDCVYGETGVLRAALDNGVPCADGASMLLHQGARAFEYWFGTPPDVGEMRSALAEELERRRG